jgi:hypothetical protein
LGGWRDKSPSNPQKSAVSFVTLRKMRAFLCYSTDCQQRQQG